ncbi:MAG TPA: ABC transporter permease, partial [Vicinamibacterales bacterium]|nr:ABC transporter permease [Vicinamibacterales bacterium]
MRTVRLKPHATRLDPTNFGGRSMFDKVMQDVRYALRLWRRRPGFAVVAIATLALGIGANTAMFTIVNAVLLRPLPFAQPERLVRLYHVPPQSTFPGIPRFSVSPANFRDWKRDATVFEDMALYRFRPMTLSGSGEPEMVTATAVGAGFFEIVGAQPAMGRVFRPEEDSPARGHVAILSDGFWKSHFGASRDVIGRSLLLDGEPYVVVGVMPPDFSMQSWAATAQPIWVPVAYTDERWAVRDNHNDSVIARLKPGATLAQAQSEMNVISERLEREYPRENAGWGATVVPLQEVIVGDVRASLLMLLVAVGLVLLIACANVGNLLFTRALARRKELAIRSALGAGRGRVFQQLVVESMLLAFAGGAVGLLLARVALGTGSALLAGQVPRAEEISMDGRVLLFAIAASIVTGILAGAFPAIRAGRTDVNDALKEGGRESGAVGVRTRRLLIICEVAMSVVLLMGAGVMVRSASALRHVDTGFNPSNVLTMYVSLPEKKYATAPRITAFYESVLQRLRALPGVQSAAAVDDLPVTGGSVQPIVLEGRPELLPRDQPTVAVRKITTEYLRTMGIPLVRGRDVADGDVDVMLVSRSAAALLWGDVDPIGRRVTLPLESKTRLSTVVGIVGDVKQGELSEAAMPTVYEYTREYEWSHLALVLRTSVPPASLASAASAAVHAVDPAQPVEQVRPMDDIMDELVTSQRFTALVLGVFAAVALVLASVGIYSVLSYIVRGRSREIGVRTALGARTADVLRLVVIEGMTPALIGIAAGAVAALGSATLLRTLVFGVSAWDPLTLAVVSAALTLSALLASLLPAYRASRLDPLTVLRAS